MMSPVRAPMPAATAAGVIAATAAGDAAAETSPCASSVVVAKRRLSLKHRPSLPNRSRSKKKLLPQLRPWLKKPKRSRLLLQLK